MSMILESDIIYSILPHADLPTIGKLLCGNKFVNKLCSNKYFWEEKIKNDYKNVIPKSDEWLYEYKCIYTIHVKSIKFIDNFIAKNIECIRNNSALEFSVHMFESINLDHFRWIPEISKMNLENAAKTIILYAGNIEKICVSFTVFTPVAFVAAFNVYLTLNQLTDYVINVHYNHHCIHLTNVNGKEIIPF